MNNANNLAAYIWSLADLLRGDFKQSQYGRVILPFTLLRRLEGVLEKSKPKVLEAYEKKIKKLGLPEEAEEKLLLRETGGLSFYNISKMDLGKLGEADIKDNLESYVQGFSKDAREIFEYFNFGEFIGHLSDANLLYKVVQRVRQTDLSLEAISNYEMGLVFEELIRRFAESSNETAGEHFTPRDIIHLTTSLVFMEDDDALSKPGIIRTIYDPTAGTGGFLSAGMEYVHELNPNAVMRAFGQELNPESFAICKADMLIKGQDVSNIKLGNTLSNDQLYTDRFDYMLSNPPFGVDWKKVEGEIKEEHQVKGYDGRFGPGLPRVSDGSLLFLMHLISKLRDAKDGGARIGIILNGSPLFTGGAGSGESEIRRYILEADLLEAIVALPTDMSKERKGKVQLINGVNLFEKMRKSLGSKRHMLGDADIKAITRCFGTFEPVEAGVADTPQNGNGAAKTFACKIFDYHEFGYRRITVERPLRESYQFSDERIETLRYASGALNAPMKWLFDTYGESWEDYGDLKDHEADIRKHVKKHFGKLKEKQIKELLSKNTWNAQRQILKKARAIQEAIGTNQRDDMNRFDADLKKAGVKLDAAEKKQIQAAVSWKNPEAAKVIKKVHKKKADPLYSLFEENKKVVEYQSDSDLRDNENIPLDPTRPVKDVIEEYFKKEVLPHVPEAWIDAGKTDPKDGEIGLVGYEIPFNRHFYVYKPPRPLAEIDADLDKVSDEIMKLLREVHS